MPLTLAERAAVQGQARQLGLENVQRIAQDPTTTSEQVLALAGLPELGAEARLNLVRTAYAKRLEPIREQYRAKLDGGA